MNQTLVVMMAQMALIIMETTAAAMATETEMGSRMEKEDHKMVAVMVLVVMVVMEVMEMVEIALMVVLMVPILTLVIIQETILVKTKTKTMMTSHANPIPYKYSVKAS